MLLAPADSIPQSCVVSFDCAPADGLRPVRLFFSVQNSCRLKYNRLKLSTVPVIMIVILFNFIAATAPRLRWFYVMVLHYHHFAEKDLHLKVCFFLLRWSQGGVPGSRVDVV
jgi:hypothetical protein